MSSRRGQVPLVTMARGLPFPDAESSYSNLAMLMEQEKFSDDMDPKIWARTSNCLGVALCPAWWTKDSLLLSFFLPHTFALFHRRGKKNLPSGQRPKFPLDSFLGLLCCSKMISPIVLEKRESGKNKALWFGHRAVGRLFSNPGWALRRFFRCIPHTSFGGGRKGTHY